MDNDAAILTLLADLQRDKVALLNENARLGADLAELEERNRRLAFTLATYTEDGETSPDTPAAPA